MSFKIVERNIGLNARNDIDGFVKPTGCGTGFFKRL